MYEKKLKLWLQLLAVIMGLQISSTALMPTVHAADQPLNTAQSRGMRFGDLKNWMSQSWNVIKAKPYHSLSMIGTHDSGTYNLRYLAGTQISGQVKDTMQGLLSSPIAGIVWETMDSIN